MNDSPSLLGIFGAAIAGGLIGSSLVVVWSALGDMSSDHADYAQDQADMGLAIFLVLVAFMIMVAIALFRPRK